MATKVTLRKADKENLVGFIKDELNSRRNSSFRKQKEEIWKEVDRQVAMEAPAVVNRSQGGAEEDWHNAIQLGHLADAVEIRTADTMRLAFPIERKWFHPHVEIPTPNNEAVEPKIQRQTDGLLRSLMVQQQKDFGFRDRVKMSVSEALKHGGFAATVTWKMMKKFHDGSRLDTLSAPVWDVYSMWNTYPDPSPEIQGTDLFYQGSMIFTKKMRASRARKMPKWRAKSVQESKDGMTELTYFYGDAVVTRSQSDLWFPNRLIILSGDEIVYTEVNETPFSPVIYTGYEKEDPRSPYYTSPIMKRSPSLQIATRSANKFLDAIDQQTEPPIEYDQMSYPNGAPDLGAGAVNERVGGQGTSVISVADPTQALQGLQLGIQHVEQGIAVDQVRAGVTPGTEQTATEVMTVAQRAEVREVEFVSILENQALLPFLYMQHDLNMKKLDDYPFYNDERTTSDYIRVTDKELHEGVVKGVRFEITGSKQVLGEIERSQKFLNVVSYIGGNEMLAQKVDWDEVLSQAFQDTGIKDPERFIVGEQGDRQAEIQRAVEQAQQAVMEEVQPRIEQLQKQLAQSQAQQEVGLQRVQVEAQIKQQGQQMQLQLDQEEMQREQDRKDIEMQREQDREDAKVQAEIEQKDALTEQKLRESQAKQLEAPTREPEEKDTGPKVVTLKRTDEGLQAEVS